MSTVLSLIGKVGQGPYLDGSSTKPGWLYQPMGDFFPALALIPSHKTQATRHTFKVINDLGGHEGTLLDIGCSTGYYLAGLRDRYLSAFGCDADPAAVAVAKELGLNVVLGFEHLKFARYMRPVTALALNIHMWWHKQHVADQMMDEIAERADRLFFQTAGSKSGGIYRVPEFKTAADEDYYLSRWFDRRELVDTTALHGGVRHLWLCQK